MSTLLVRHGLSEANNRKNVGGLAFAAESAPLMELGREQARNSKGIFIARFGINPSTEPAATSELLRTQQTAEEAGFMHTNSYAQLDEVKHGLNLVELRAMLDSGNLPRAAIEAAEETLGNPPPEQVWFTHGLCIAGICAVLGVHQDERLIPRFCEIREISIPV